MDLPIGTIIMYDGTTLPYGWYDCDGGTYNGLVTPDLIGSFPRGVPSAGTLGATGGSVTHDHSNSNTGNASHGHAGKTDSTGGRVGTIGSNWAGGSYETVNDHNHTITVAAITGAEIHNHTMPNTDEASSLPPYIRLRYIIRCE